MGRGQWVRCGGVDGGHDADLVVNDLETADRAVSDNGLVVLDDMYNFAWPEVAEGFFRFMSSRPGAFVPLAIGFNKAVLTRPRGYELYSPYFRNPGRSMLLPSKVSVTLPLQRHQYFRLNCNPKYTSCTQQAT
ncbi:MAG: class I SAM-dependent methyltransferase, partial [bacterium]|nr:class I SAM-dependent methyltransferase [bacterium]